MRLSTGNPFPSYTKELLLKAALLEGEEMLHAYSAWKKKIDFEKDIEYASFRTLPLLYQNLNKHKISDDLSSRLKGIYRQSWSKNHLLFFKAQKVLGLLQNAGIKTLVMKGIALSVLTYKNYSVRPMADMDILIPFAQARQAIGLLSVSGWAIQNPQYLEYNLKYGRSATFTDKDKLELDLHWHPIFEAHDNISENDFWDFAVPLSVKNVETLAFCDTDVFFHTIVHGLRYNPEPPIRWIADAMTILKLKNHAVDWDRLLQHTQKFRVVLYMEDALNYLMKEFRAEIPGSFITEINKIKVTYIDKFVFKHAQKYGDKNPETFYEKIVSVYAGFMRQTSIKGFWRQHIGFYKYMLFRTKGKPYFKVFMYQFSLLFKKK